ncbi:hypothetical protein PCANC_13799 [Puccinia coronata f. sp. avenae]|uniref:Mediator complex subunit 9 n=1 Tax=Puccinia coronata f. sp. avenae TaxID=200324 RepID=A0A2N5UFU5_9BASI|nr:hypothetical protein PCANC_21173 [Puccinia coronata f. sp. avenae]PLW13388.1 hypothetical protein PCASD_19192 [Puccinia coronata f. sp. avenae]PLW36612.1 hypothetical protein PCASD_11367 [Puccinia coronata f. sp. avenae]PLW44123.1 hypothetical protein PCANC_13799 [Puccinia coronata f. sp. avenae]
MDGAEAGRAEPAWAQRLLLEPRAGKAPADSQPEEADRLDRSMAVSLVEQLKQLLIHTLTSDGTPESKLDISNQANLLKVTVGKLERQLQLLPAGDLSLRDQEELIAKLENRIDVERQVLRFMAETLPAHKEVTNNHSGSGHAAPTTSDSNIIQPEIKNTTQN